MSLPQLHYTSVASGDAVPAGRFTAVDPAIAGPVRAEAAPLLAYDAPEGTPDRLTDTRLRSLPVAFAFAALSDGSHLLSRTVATATGGFHAHAVHLPRAWRYPAGCSPWPPGGPSGGCPRHPTARCPIR